MFPVLPVVWAPAAARAIAGSHPTFPTASSTISHLCRYALWSLSLVTDAASRLTIEREGGIGLLIGCLVRLEVPGHWHRFSLWLFSVPCSALPFAVPPVHFLVNPLGFRQVSLAAQEHAATVLALLARELTNCLEIVRAGGIPPLVALLPSASIGAKRQAATGLARLAASGADTQAVIANAGALGQLHRWVAEVAEGGTTDRRGGLPELAARALDQIAIGNKSTSLAIIAQGSIKPLVAMLHVGRSTESQKAAAGLLATLSQVTTTVSIDQQASPRSTAATRGGSDVIVSADVANEAAVVAAQKDGCGASAPIAVKAECADDVEADFFDASGGAVSSPCVVASPAADLIAEAGGIAPLVQLLMSERVPPHENATRAIWCLANTQAHQMPVARAGAIAPLVLLLHKGSAETKQHAAAAVEALARHSDENQATLAKAKAISPLVTQLASERGETQQHAVGAH